MRLGLNLSYWTNGNDASNVTLAQEAERLGYSVVWVSEAYGSDAVTVLTWIAAHTTRIDVGTAVMQIPARTPATTAMTAATVDTLSAGRFRLGLGVSGPQVSEGWHGVRFSSPLGRTREYVTLVRRALRGETLEAQGNHFVLPLPDGPGKALSLTISPAQDHVPIYLAALGPKNIELAGEIADGWLPTFFSPGHAAKQLESLRAGLARSGRHIADVDIAPTVPLVAGKDWVACARRVRAYAALYFGGMGGRHNNHYAQLAARMGFEAEIGTVQDRFLAGDYPAAMAAVPLELIDATSLLGPAERIAERLTSFAEAGVTTLNVLPVGLGMPGADRASAALRTTVEAAELAGL
jgi:F420-dependent oxidoreductase-like protein